MKMTVIGFTRESRGISPQELDSLKIHCGKNAGISQLRNQYFDSAVSDPEKAAKRFIATTKMKHLSIADHAQVEVLFEDASRFMAMLLNSLQYYATTEKSGRYTEMRGNSPEQCVLYDKWNAIFKKRILEVYPDYNDAFIKKQLTTKGLIANFNIVNGRVYEKPDDGVPFDKTRPCTWGNDVTDLGDIAKTMSEIMENPRLPVNTRSQENARYILSIFTKSTTFGYTTSLSQWNYIYDWCRKYMANFKWMEWADAEAETLIRMDVSPERPATWFERQVYDDLENLQDYIYKNLYCPEIRDRKKRGFDMLTELLSPEHPMGKYDPVKDNHTGFAYTTDYLCSFIVLSHLHRHRTLKYWMLTDSIKEPGLYGYYVPAFIKGTALEDEWLSDLDSVKNLYPQGMLIHVVESGTLDNFVLKASERYCGAAMLETMLNVKSVGKKFVNFYESGFATKLEKAYIERFYDPVAKHFHTKNTITDGCEEGCYFGCTRATDRTV